MKYVYVLRSLRNSEQLYVGITGNPEKRLIEHNQSKCSHTKKYTPWKIVYSEDYRSENEALKREKQLKRWSRAKKEALIAGDIKYLKELSKRRGER